MSSSYHVSYLLRGKHSGSAATLKGCGQIQVGAVCRKQIPLPRSQPSASSRNAEIHLDSRWLQAAGLQTPGCNLTGGCLHTGVGLAELP